MTSDLHVQTGVDFFIAKINAVEPLSEKGEEAIRGLPMHIQQHAAGQDLIREGDPASGCYLLLEGLTCRYKLVENGRRQVFAFHVPGDMPDLLNLHLKISDHSLATVIPTVTGMISHGAINELVASHPEVAAALWRDTLIDGAIFREWMIGMGRRTARERVAHLLCEMALRLKVVGLSNGRSARLPLTQETIGDALGLSTVHINRVLRDLREEELIIFRGGQLHIGNWANLAGAGQFDVGYLHLAAGELWTSSFDQQARLQSPVAPTNPAPDHEILITGHGLPRQVATKTPQ